MAFVRSFDNKDRIIGAGNVVAVELAGTDINVELVTGEIVKVGEGADAEKATALQNAIATNLFARH